MIVLNGIFILIFIYLAISVGYISIFCISGLFMRLRQYHDAEPHRKFAILIPAYKEDDIIFSTISAVLKQDYPKDKFDVFLIADQLRSGTIVALNEFPISVIPVSFSNSTKARSIKYAIQQMPCDVYDIAFILDADNILGEGGLRKINHAFEMGYRMVQLHRKAKNKNTPLAILDALSEEVNNYIFRQGHRALGMSAALIGSGMALDFSSFKSILVNSDIENNPGEDREINLEMLKRGYICEYIDDAYVFDEKVQHSDVLEKQRTRWLSAQLQYAVKFWFREPIKSVSNGINYFDFAFQTLLVPRSLLIASLVFIVFFQALMEILFHIIIAPGRICWISLLVLCVFCLMTGSLNNLSMREVKLAIIGFPKACFSFIKALIKARPGQRDFIHTPKQYIEE